MNATAQKYTQTFEAPGSLTPYSSIPQRVQDFFLANTGSVLTVNSVSPEAMTQAHMTGRVPVSHQEIPEEYLSILFASGFHVHDSDGTLRKMDCCLYRQGVEERDHWRGMALARQSAMDNPEAVLEAIEDTAREGEKKRGGHRFVFPAGSESLHPGQPGTNLPPVDSFVGHDAGFTPGQED